MYVKLPFLNNECCNFLKKELRRILEYRFPYIDFRYVFINSATIQGLLSHKESLPMDLRSSLVYAYECGACGSTYLGQTKKCLRSRAGDHFGISMRTGRLLASPTQSAIRDHIENCGTGKNLSNFKCVRSFSNCILLRIFESLEITFRKPNLNRDESSYCLKLVWVCVCLLTLFLSTFYVYVFLFLCTLFHMQNLFYCILIFYIVYIPMHRSDDVDVIIDETRNK